jgi:hypothetical protein
MAGNLSTYRQSNFPAGVDLFKRLPPELFAFAGQRQPRIRLRCGGHLFFQAGELGNSLLVPEKGHVRTSDCSAFGKGRKAVSRPHLCNKFYYFSVKNITKQYCNLFSNSLSNEKADINS